MAAVDLGKYGSDVLRSMWAEIVDLRGQLRQLESTNRQLRQQTQPTQRQSKDNDDDNITTRKPDNRMDIGEKYGKFIFMSFNLIRIHFIFKYKNHRNDSMRV